MNELQETTTSRGDGEDNVDRQLGSLVSQRDEGQDEARITTIRVALGIRFVQDGFEPSEQGVIAVARDNRIPLINQKKLKGHESFCHLSAVAVGAIYGFVFCRLFDVRSALETVFLLAVGIVLAVVMSAIVSNAWSRRIRNSFESGNRSKGWLEAIATTLFIAAIDFSTIGYFIHSLLTEDLFGLPADSITLIASYGVSLMTACALTLYARLFGIEEAWDHVSRSVVVDRAMNTFHKEVAEGMLLLKRMKKAESQDLVLRHKP